MMDREALIKQLIEWRDPLGAQTHSEARDLIDLLEPQLKADGERIAEQKANIDRLTKQNKILDDALKETEKGYSTDGGISWEMEQARKARQAAKELSDG